MKVQEMQSYCQKRKTKKHNTKSVKPPKTRKIITTRAKKYNNFDLLQETKKKKKNKSHVDTYGQ